MIIARGVGWITEREYGGIARSDRSRFINPGAIEELGASGVFQHPFRNFGRLDRLSKMTAAAVGLALRDAGIRSGPEAKRDIGIIGTNSEGSLAADLHYFRDYVQCGRTLARGNLFIYTLPSSPLGEAAIHFGLVGPLFYQAGGPAPVGTAFAEAEEIVRAGESAGMLAGIASEREAVFAVFASDEPDGHGRGIDSAKIRTIADRECSVAALIQAFLEVKGLT